MILFGTSEEFCYHNCRCRGKRGERKRGRERWRFRERERWRERWRFRERDGDLGRERGRVFHTNMIVGK